MAALLKLHEQRDIVQGRMLRRVDIVNLEPDNRFQMVVCLPDEPTAVDIINCLRTLCDAVEERLRG